MADATTPIWKRRWFLIAAATLAVVGIAIVIALPIVLDVERYRPRIEQALRDATGWEPELGSIDLSFLPPAVHVGESRLDSPRTESSIAIGSLDVAARLLPLLKGTLAIEDVTLDRPRITLVRKAGDTAWDVPVPPRPEATPPAAPQTPPDKPPRKPPAEPPSEPPTTTEAERRSPIDVVVRRIRVRDGAVRIEDRSVTPPRILDVAPFGMTVFPETGALEGSAALSPDGGNLRWDGTFDAVTVTLEDFATDRLAAIVGSDLLQPGGTLSGTIEVHRPFALDGIVEGRALGLATGAQPIEQANLRFRVVSDASGLVLESTRLSLGELHVDGAGRLTPSLDLALRIPEAPLEPVLETMRAVAQFPLDVRGPGSAAADVTVYQQDGDAIRYAATGKLSAHRLVGAEFLPSIDDFTATFDLTQQDLLTVNVTKGKVAGGPMRGKLELSPVDPPGQLRFDGTLRGASLGGLLAGFVENAAEKILGPTSVQTSLALDLGREVVDATALSGTVKLTSGQITLPGWDVEGKIERDLVNRLNRLNLTSLLERDKLTQLGTSNVPVAFDAMNAQLSLDTIPWSLDRLRLSRDGGALNGSGSFNPLRGTIAVAIDVELSERKSAKLVEDHDSLRVLLDDDGRIRLPLGLKGAIDSPGVEVDLSELAQELLGKDAVQEQLIDKLKSLFDDDDD